MWGRLQSYDTGMSRSLKRLFNSITRKVRSNMKVVMKTRWRLICSWLEIVRGALGKKAAVQDLAEVGASNDLRRRGSSGKAVQCCTEQANTVASQRAFAELVDDTQRPAHSRPFSDYNTAHAFAYMSHTVVRIPFPGGWQQSRIVNVTVLYPIKLWAPKSIVYCWQ